MVVTQFRIFRPILASAVIAFLAAPGAQAQVKIGVDLALTGPTAAVIIPHQRTWKIVPHTMGGQPADYRMVDDHGDPTEAVKLVRRLTSEDNVDAVVMAGTTPICMAIAEAALETKTPTFCIAPNNVTEPRFHWIFTTPPATPVLMKPAVDHMKASGAKTIGFIGFSDSLGDVHLDALKKLAAEDGMKVVADERFERTATSLTGQVLRVMSANPDVVFIGASGTPAVLPQKTLVEQGFKGQIYHTNAVFSPDFIRLGGQDVVGAIALASPLFVAGQLPDSNPIKKIALDFLKTWDANFGAETRNPYSGFSYDAYLMLDQAVAVALKTAKPGTPEFRAALRDALEHINNMTGISGVYTMSPTDHNGVDARSVVLVKLEAGGAWKLVP